MCSVAFTSWANTLVKQSIPLPSYHSLSRSQSMHQSWMPCTSSRHKTMWRNWRFRWLQSLCPLMRMICIHFSMNRLLIPSDGVYLIQFASLLGNMLNYATGSVILNSMTSFYLCISLPSLPPPISFTWIWFLLSGMHTFHSELFLPSTWVLRTLLTWFALKFAM